MKFYLVRHCSTSWKKFGYLSFTDLPLSEEGRREAREAANVLKQLEFERIITSPLLRARETAEIISEITAKEVSEDEGLKEVNFGIFEGLSRDEARERYPEIFEHREGDKWNFRIPKGESYSDALKRVSPLLSKIIKRGKPVVLVTHATMIKIIVKHLTNMPLEEIEKMRFKPGCVIEVRSRGKQWEIKVLNG